MEALKILLAEDDFYVREYIKSIINAKKQEFCIVYEAEDGESAYNYLRENSVDIIITDIEMPIMSGLEILQRLKHEGRSEKSIIISAYEEFDYAKKALELDVCEYILKPLSQEQVLENLQKVRDSILKERMLKDQLSKINPLLKEKFIRDLIFDRYNCSTEELYAKALEHGINLSKENFSVFTIDIVEHNHGGEQEQCNNILAYCRQLLPSYDFEICLDGLNRIIVILSSNDEPDELYEDIVLLCNRVIEYAKDSLNMDILIGFAGVCSNMGDLSKCYFQSLKALDYKDIVTGKHLFILGEKPNDIVYEVKSYIEANFADPEINLCKIAHHVNVSPSYLSYLFKKECNQNISKILTNFRIEKAKSLIKLSQYQVNEIAYKVGYSDPAYFCKVFKKHTGKTPGEYKEA